MWNLDDSSKTNQFLDKDSVLPKLNNNLMSLSGTSESVAQEKSFESLEDANKSQHNLSPYTIELKKHIKNYIKTKEI